MSLDLTIIVIWAGVAGLAGLGARAAGFDFGSPVKADSFAFAFLVAPVIVSFARQEASTRQATFGKYRLGLCVTDDAGHRLSLGRALVRSALKFAPWQLAHSAVFRLVSGSESVIPVVLAIGAQVIVVASVAFMAVDNRHRAFHDVVAGTRVRALTTTPK